MRLKTSLYHRRPQFLLLDRCVASEPIVSAAHGGFFSLLRRVLFPEGVVFWNISENVANDYIDYRSGTDLRTRRIPSSGGGGLLTSTLCACALTV